MTRISANSKYRYWFQGAGVLKTPVPPLPIQANLFPIVYLLSSEAILINGTVKEMYFSDYWSEVSPVEHPIEGFMKTAMENIRGIVDVNTVVGDPVETPDGTVIIPVSRVACGFAAGGSAFSSERPESGAEAPFGGGSGAGVSVQPVGFLVVKGENIRLLPVEGNHLAERILDLAPQIIEKIEGMRQRKYDH